MKLHLKRIKRPGYCIGRLSIDGVYFCDTCEDTDRGLTQDTPLAEIKKIKVSTKTAIPTGTYEITMKVKSPKYSKKAFYWNFCRGLVPRLLNVPGFEGILIHIGNSAADSAGCILVGKNTEVGKVLNSRATFKELYKRLKEADKKGEKITITIE